MKNLNSTKGKTISIVFLCIILFSCKNEKNKSTVENFSRDKLNIKDSTEINSKVHLEFVNQKTKKTVNKLYKDSTYLFLINYKNDEMDTLNTNIFEEGDKKRHLYFYKADKTRIDLSNKDISYIEKNIKLDTFYAVNNRQIPVFDITFKHKGYNYLNGIIDDFVYLKLKDTAYVRVISEKNILMKKVFVE